MMMIFSKQPPGLDCDGPASKKYRDYLKNLVVFSTLKPWLDYRDQSRFSRSVANSMEPASLTIS